jgi:hypothetical protein
MGIYRCNAGVLCGAGAIARESQQRRLHSSSGDSGNIALWSKRTSFGSAGKASSTLTGASNPVAGSGQRVAADIAISRAEIGFSFGSDDDAVNHLPSRVFRLQFVEHLIGGRPAPFLAWAKPRRMLATTSRWPATSWYAVASRSTASALPFTVSTSGRPVFFMRFIRPDELRLNVVRE